MYTLSVMLQCQLGLTPQCRYSRSIGKPQGKKICVDLGIAQTAIQPPLPVSIPGTLRHFSLDDLKQLL